MKTESGKKSTSPNATRTPNEKTTAYMELGDFVQPNKMSSGHLPYGSHWTVLRGDNQNLDVRNTNFILPPQADDSENETHMEEKLSLHENKA